VNVKTDVMAAALARLQTSWPRGVRVGDLFADTAGVVDDLRLLHRYGMVDLRLVEPAPVPSGPLHAAERGWGAEVTTPYHTREPA
jgi:hypothetical protein